MKTVTESVRNVLIYAAAYYVAYAYSMSFSQYSPAPLWLPDSVMFCALFISPVTAWWIYIAACLPIRLFVSVPPNAPLWFLIACYANDAAKAVISVWLVRKMTRGKSPFDAARSAAGYIVIAAGLVPALSATAGAASRMPLGDDFFEAWRQWFIGDAMANLVLTPMLLSIFFEWKQAFRIHWWRFTEAFVLGAGLIATAQGAFDQRVGSDRFEPFHLYAPLPFMLWAAIRFGPVGASISLFIMGFISITAAGAGRGAFSASPAAQNILATQLFIVVLAVPLIMLSVILQQQRGTEASLRESEQRFREMIDHSPLMVWMCGVDGRCTFFNKPWLDFTGRSLEQELGQGWTEGVHPADRDRCITEYLAAFDARVSFTLEYRLRRKDGTYRWVLYNGDPRLASDGRFVGYIGSCIDITDRRSVEEKLRESEEMLRRLSAQAIYAQEAERRRIGQELHDDLAQRVAGLSVLLSKVARESAHSARFSMLQQRAEQISVDLARLSHGLRPAGLESLGLSAALEKLAEESSSPQHLQVSFTDAGNIPDLPWDAALPLYRVAQEALQNALKHSGAKNIEIELRATGDALELSIADDGCGFSMDTVQGRGLGLAGMAERMRMVGGSLNIDSSSSGGTRVYASLPLSKSEVSKSEVASA